MAIDEASRTAIAGAAEALRRDICDAKPRVSWARPAGWHVTLKFFGDVASERLAALSGVLETAARGVARFELVLRGLFGFPPRGRPRALVIGIRDDGSSTRLAEAIDAGAHLLRFEREARAYLPHLTVARLRDANASRVVAEVVGPYREMQFGTVAVEEIGLYESVLDPGGAIYRRVEAFPLAAR